MCGIIGIKFFNTSPEKSDQDWVNEVLTMQQHRGPDFSYSVITGNAVLGHNRLAIVDLNSRSNQPFFDVSKRYSIVYNGEIYNYHELKNDLLKKGYVFNTSSDTEVLLYHLIEYGAEGINELNGCFAFGFYDSRDDELILARDHMGINPLLFSIEEDKVVFASELWPFSKLSEPRTISHKALNDYFRFTYISAPQTIFNEVQKLLPGHYVTIKGKFLDVVKYWSPANDVKFEGDVEEAKSELRSRLEHAIISRLEADVPVGTFLSGGVDSSIVSAVSANFKSDLHTFSVGFLESEYFDESDFAHQVAAHIKSNHHAIRLSSNIVVDELKSVLDSFDEPFGDSSAIAMYFLAKGAKEKLTVCLSGDGADELFAGYNKHRAFEKSNSKGLLTKIVKGIPSFGKGSRSTRFQNRLRQLNNFKVLLSQNGSEKYWFLATFIEDEYRNKLVLHPILESPKSAFHIETLNDFLLLDQQFVLPNDMLKKVDVMSMRHSLEVRTPFLDKHVVKFANSLPEEFKLYKGQTKRILKEAFSDALPKQIVNRSKKGFEVPLEVWLKKAWNDITKSEWFDSVYLKEQNLFHAKYVLKLKQEFLEKKGGHLTTLIWCYIVFQSWYANTLKND